MAGRGIHSSLWGKRSGNFMPVLTRPRSGVCLGHLAHQPRTLRSGAALAQAHTPCHGSPGRLLE